MRDLSRLRLPEREAIPAWYRLGFKSPDTLLVIIHNSAWEFVRAFEYERTFYPEMVKEFRFEDFIPPTVSPWGFGRRTLWGPEAPIEVGPSRHPEWTLLKCALPVDRKDVSHQQFMAVRASLSLLFNFLRVFGFEGDTGWPKPQLMIIDGLQVECGFHGGSLWATLTPSMMRYLNKQSDGGELGKVHRAIKTSFRHMLRRRNVWKKDYYYRIQYREPKWIHLDVPGDACGLDPDDRHDVSLDVGYKLCPHNVDSSFQQLGLLVGLAKLCQLAVKDLWR
ncbi:MAG: hypothetical protein AAB589_00865 [Patescibacteria group bacterium]